MSGSYELGYEDAEGNFVKAAEIETPTENLSDPLIIRHEDSGNTIELNGDGVSVGDLGADSVNTDDATITGTVDDDGTLRPIDDATRESYHNELDTDIVNQYFYNIASAFTVGTTAESVAITTRFSEYTVIGFLQGSPDTVFIDKVYSSKQQHSVSNKLENGGPAARSYSGASSFDLEIAMASGDYNIVVNGWRMNP